MRPRTNGIVARQPVRLDRQWQQCGAIIDAGKNEAMAVRYSRKVTWVLASCTERQRTLMITPGLFTQIGTRATQIKSVRK